MPIFPCQMLQKSWFQSQVLRRHRLENRKLKQFRAEIKKARRNLAGLDHASRRTLAHKGFLDYEFSRHRIRALFKARIFHDRRDVLVELQ